MAVKKKITFQFFIPVNGEYKPLTEEMMKSEEFDKYKEKVRENVSRVLSAMARSE